MDRTQQAATTNLLDYEGRIIANILERARNTVMTTTARVTNKSNTGEAAYNSVQVELESEGLVRACEDLLSLTRQLRELWVIGPLRKAGEGEAEAEAAINAEVQQVVNVLNELRTFSRGRAMGAHGTYKTAPMPPVVVGAGAAPAAAAAAPGTDLSSASASAAAAAAASGSGPGSGATAPAAAGN